MIKDRRIRAGMKPAEFRQRLMELNQLRVEADLDHEKRNQRFEQILRDLMAGTLPTDQGGRSEE